MPDSSRPIVRPAIARLALPDLEMLEADFCRALMRNAWWEGAKGSKGCLGQMVKHFLDQRSQIDHERQGDNFKEFKQADLLKCLRTHPKNRVRLRSINKASLSQFLSGRPPGDRWFSVARAALQYILLGTELNSGIASDGKSPAASPSGRQAEAAMAHLVAQRIVSFFFPQEHPEQLREPPDIAPDNVWFFSESVSNMSIPATSRDAAAELRSLAYDCSVRKKSCRITRVSGRSGFKQVTDDCRKLTPTGELTIECLKAGVQVVYMFPNTRSKENQAANSAESFEMFARERLADSPHHLSNLVLVRINPDEIRGWNQETRWAGEFLSSIMVFALYEREGSPRTLIVSRSSNQWMTAFSPDHSEKETLSSWIAAFHDERDHDGRDAGENGERRSVQPDVDHHASAATGFKAVERPSVLLEDSASDAGSGDFASGGGLVDSATNCDSQGADI